MAQNRLYLIIGALLVIVAGLGFYVWQEQSKPEGVQIQIGPDGLKVEQN
ncbi:MAG: hypothetical protein WBA44_01555 [Mesorhizobium sp.]